MTPEQKARYIGITQKVLWITMLVWFTYEIVILILGKDSALISPVILSFVQNRPQFLLFLGYLLGHLTWPQKVVVSTS